LPEIVWNRGIAPAETAERGKRSLGGYGPYADRFHAAVVKVTGTEKKVRPHLDCLSLRGEDLTQFDESLTVLKGTATKAKGRVRAQRALRLVCETVIMPKADGMTASPIPTTESVLPMDIVRGTRRNYIIQVIVQANGSYERQWYDACSVMVRRFVETLIIEVYEAKGGSEEIKTDGRFFMLNGLIDNIVKKTAWNLQRDSQAVLPLLKQVGDRSAHGRRYLATKQDIDKILPGLRVLADDLLHLAGLK
jgi:hypothetical protein